MPTTSFTGVFRLPDSNGMDSIGVSYARLTMFVEDHDHSIQ